LQPTNECECRDILTVMGYLVPLALEVADVRFEAIALSHFDGEKVVVFSLSLLADTYQVRNTSDTSSK